MAGYVIKNNELWDKSSHRICVIQEGQIKDGKRNKRLAVIKGDEIKDEYSNKRIGKVKGNTVEDGSGNKITTVSSIVNMIDNSHSVNPVYLAAIWITCLKD